MKTKKSELTSSEMVRKRNILEALEAIELIVSDGFSFDMEYNLVFDRLKTETEKEAAKKLGQIYVVAHAINPKHSCFSVHSDWREKIKEIKEAYKNV